MQVQAKEEILEKCDFLPSKPFLLRAAEFVKISHSVFALPFALISMLVADPSFLANPRTFFWILICMVSARTAAMAFNRVADWEWDQKNPRTATRRLLISKTAAKVLIFISTVLFVLATTQLNSLCVLLSPAAIALVFLYSLTKRFTAYSHFFLGLALSAAPVGAWAAIHGSLTNPIPFILGLAALLWVFGFDLIYATLDIEFDRQIGLFSFPARYGVAAALKLSLILHAGAWIALGLFGWMANLRWPYWVAWSCILIGLWVEQYWARTSDTRRINQAFFEVNAGVSVALLLGTLLSEIIAFVF